MSRAIPRASLRGAVLVLFILTQLLTPLLHGHFGTPIQTGLHVHAGLPAETDSHFPAAASQMRDDAARADSSLASGDSLEVDVESGVGRLVLGALIQPAVLPGLSILTLVLLAALASDVSRRVPFYRAPAPRWRYRFSRPPPAQAPPQFS
ncbi:hypothetical protein C2U69_24610 [Cupriavidus pinatubonensis]|nr:hypothetical protein C2U69_24610 [Cupriavidus pinatubonensis]